MLFLDNDLQIAEKDAHLYNKSMVSPLVEAGVPLHDVAILGGGDGRSSMSFRYITPERSPWLV